MPLKQCSWRANPSSEIYEIRWGNTRAVRAICGAIATGPWRANHGSLRSQLHGG